ncbi:MAG: hypothetical protein LAO78_23900 [Acidobacteriia bacterium]|nr:hypothetical protein [Terriglobia bacterium]
MADNRMSGMALIAGMAGSIITMAFHPTGHDLVTPEHSASMMQLNVVVHSLALVCIPILFMGALGLTQRLASPNRLALAGLVLFGFAEVAVMIAAVASGLVAPGLFHHMAADPGMADIWRAVLTLNGHLNQAFAQVYVVASSAAIVLWSAAILRSGTFSRPLGLYGCILGPLTVIAVLSGHIRLNVHGFGLVILGQALWLITAGVLLCKEEPAQSASK